MSIHNSISNLSESEDPATYITRHKSEADLRVLHTNSQKRPTFVVLELSKQAYFHPPYVAHHKPEVQGGVET